jgi:hypothetical protein
LPGFFVKNNYKQTKNKKKKKGLKKVLMVSQSRQTVEADQLKANCCFANSPLLRKIPNLSYLG